MLAKCRGALAVLWGAFVVCGLAFIRCAVTASAPFSVHVCPGIRYTQQIRLR
ncbi:uncharacterized protein K441DRAFT_670019 [Cenococcum geophilum 1.58]|uniref:Uncharacterized protein n=1 Tax=Cenococcum geophilum 1.58 TaxID=794803 RepID=A0ACC8ENH2_9PEZI|nr:hypothetical protein K441DRAFT_670019 [Cenococcum geophilum 1.58]